jgi:hypothetical protein
VVEGAPAIFRFAENAHHQKGRVRPFNPLGRFGG